MKIKVTIGIILMLFLAYFMQAQAGENKKGEVIKYYSYEEGLKKAESDSMHVAILFETSWCGWCKKMDKTTLVDPDVVEIMNSDFVAIKVDGDKRRDLTKSFGVRGYPATWFLKSDGTRLAPIQGYWQAEDFYWLLKYISEYAYEKEDFKPWVEKQKKKNG